MGDLRVSRARLDDPDVEAAWTRLQADGWVDTPFLSWEWFSAMRDVPELAAVVDVLVCRSGPAVVGLLPVERVRLDGLRTVGIAGWHWAGPDHSDVIAATADRPAVADAILGALARSGGWDVLDLDGLAPDGALATAVDATFRRPWFVARPDEELPVNFVPLDAEILSTHGRKQVRKELRRAEASGGGFRAVTDPQEFPKLLDQMMELHVARFGDRSRVFATPERRRFHHLAAERLGEAGKVRMHALTVGEEPAAITYTLGWNGSLLFYSGGLRTDIGMTPGFSVRAAAMTAAAEAGYREVDLLRGDHGYKDRFTTVVRPDVRKRVIRLNATTAGQGALRAAHAVAARIRDRVVRTAG